MISILSCFQTWALCLIAIFFAACATTPAQTASPTVELAPLVHGFRLVQVRQVPEMGIAAKLFVHEQSGARLLKMEANDEHKMFCISFKTPPNSDNGIAHILEHSVLNGSRKFPVKSPFTVLTKGSLGTFLNAMTGDDYTLYPIASINTKDFYNLMDVYLDAVFFPKIHEQTQIMKQEGWHYHLDQADGKLTYNGVVYNEMKGAYSSPQAELGRLTQSTLFPDTAYRFESGGLPEAIPTLTQEAFREFHRKYYHPANSYIALYGNGDTDEELRYLDENYLSQFQRREPATAIALQKPFTAMKEVVSHYPIPTGAQQSDKTYLSMSFVVDNGTRAEDLMMMEILGDVLVDLPGAPIRRALLDAGIGSEVYSYVNEIKQPVLSIVAKNANPEDQAKFKRVVFDTLRRVAKEGLDSKMIDGAIAQREFRLREADYHGFSKGIVYLFRALPGWIYEQDPFATLPFQKSLERAKRARNDGSFEKLIERKLLNNPHSVLAVVSPKPGLGEERDQALATKLAARKASFSPEQIQQLVADTAALKQFQSRPDRPEDLAKVPLLELADLNPKAIRLPLQQKTSAGVPVLFFEDDTNDITYLQLLFDAQVVPQELIPYVSLLADILGELDTQKHSYRDLNAEIDIHTGGIYFSLVNHVPSDNYHQYQPKFVVHGKSLRSQLEPMLGFQSEILRQSLFGETKRLREVLNKVHSNLQSMAYYNGIGLAVTRLESYYSEAGQYNEQISGLSYHKFVAGLVKQFDQKSPEISVKLQKVAQLLFNQGNMIIGLTGSQAEYQQLERSLPGLLARLGQTRPAPQKYSFTFETRNEGLVTASKVQYVTKGYNFRDLGYQYSGKFNVLKQILSRDYLHDKIRVQGGAYGAWMSLRRSGQAYFGSYRDPHLRQTLDNYDRAVDYLKNFQASDREMTRYIIGTISKLDRPMTPSIKGRRAISEHFQKITYLQKQKERDEVLATRPKDIRAMNKMIKDILKKNFICVYGNEKKIEEQAELFTKLFKVID